MEFIQTQNPIYRQAIMALYIEAFTTQYINRVELETYINSILEKGYAFLALKNKELVGAILCYPLKFDNMVPENIRQNYSTDKCIYVAEMMVAAFTRGQGIGKKLMAEFFNNVDKSTFPDVFIRVWDQNIPALTLYKKMGFEPVGNIEQTKKKADGSETFVMQKIYLHKKLN